MTQATTTWSPGPLKATDRIVSLDVLRGFAVLGILVMNIQSFGMPFAAYLNPTSYGDLSGVNLAAWFASHLLVNQKFLALFSILFGAGVCLFADRAEAKLGRCAGLHYRRMFWLLLFGLAHGYLLWSGDILAAYAVCGSVIFIMRNRSPLTLALAGVAVYAVASALSFFVALVPEVLSAEDAADLSAMWMPSQAEIDAELLAYRGGWLVQQAYRVPATLAMHFVVLPSEIFWQSCGLMLMGMALYRWQILGAARSDRFYRRLVIAGFGIGAPVVLAGVWWNFQNDWSWESSMFAGSQFNYLASPVMALGYIGLVMSAVRRGWFRGLQKRFAAAGRMAFTNYIAQTLICTTLFYGHGLGLFGKADRWQLLVVVVIIWIAQLWWSPPLLKRLRYGPLEWAWRSLTYWRFARR